MSPVDAARPSAPRASRHSYPCRLLRDERHQLAPAFLVEAASGGGRLPSWRFLRGGKDSGSAGRGSPPVEGSRWRAAAARLTSCPGPCWDGDASRGDGRETGRRSSSRCTSVPAPAGEPAHRCVRRLGVPRDVARRSLLVRGPVRAAGPAIPAFQQQDGLGRHHRCIHVTASGVPGS